MRHTQWTYWRINKATPEAHEHITLRYYSNGDVEALSRDPIKATRPRWVLVGFHEASDKPGVPASIQFFTDSHPIRVAATHLFRQGCAVIGATVHPWTFITEARRTNRITKPESLMGNVKTRSLDLGGTAKGERGARTFGRRFSTNINEMHAAILRRRGFVPNRTKGKHDGR